MDLWQAAIDGAHAVECGDYGRSKHLIQEISDAMARGLTIKECEWLALAVMNGVQETQFRLSMSEPIEVNTELTPKGEIWDL